MSWICPGCGEICDDNFDFCEICGYERTDNIQASTDGKWVIVCPNCGEKNIVENENSYLDICPLCGSTDIEIIEKAHFELLVSEVEDNKQKSHPVVILKEIIGEAVSKSASFVNCCPVYRQKSETPDYTGTEIKVNSDETIIGRNCFPPEFAKIYSFISEIHCRIIYNSEKQIWNIEDLRSTNGTFLNGKRLLGSMSRELERGSLLQLADKLFIVEMI